jgi:Toprim domain/Zinc-binding domain of primase-helicase
MTALSVLDLAHHLGATGLRRISSSERAGPCPICGGRDRFAVNMRKDVWHCRHCGKGGDAIALARHVAGLSYTEACRLVGDEDALDELRRRREARWQAPPPAPAEHRPDPEKAAQALALWRAGVDPRGTLAEPYLNSRGLALDADLAGRVLRWHASAGAMLALFRNVQSGAPQAVSRTFLTSDSRKTGRKFLGPVGGAAIMLDPPTDELTVAEGVESAMTARALGAGPAWACGSAGAIAALAVIPGVAHLRVCIERDANGTSERAALAVAERWRAAGRAVTFRLPPPRCKDLNDAIRSDQR